MDNANNTATPLKVPSKAAERPRISASKTAHLIITLLVIHQNTLRLSYIVTSLYKYDLFNAKELSISKQAHANVDVNEIFPNSSRKEFRKNKRSVVP